MNLADKYRLGIALAVCMLLSVFQLTGQTAQLSYDEGDSVSQVVRALMKDAEESRTTDVGRSASLAKQARSVAEISKDNKGWVESSMLLFTLYHTQGSYREALKVNEELIDKKEWLTKAELGVIYMRFGVVYFRLGHSAEAFDYYETSMPYILNGNSVKNKSALYTNLGVLMAGLGDEEEALSYFAKVSELIEDTLSLSFAKNENNIATRFVNLKRYDLALDHYFKALSIHTYHKNSLGMARVHLNRSRCYRLMGRFGESKREIKKAFELLISAPNENMEFLTWMMLGAIYDAENIPDSAIYALKKAESFGLQIPLRQKEMYGMLQEAYFALENFEEAYHYLELQKQVEDTLLNREKNLLKRKLSLQQAKLEQEKELELAEKEKEREILLKNFLLGLTILIVFSALLIIYYQRGKAKKEKELLQAKEYLTRAELANEQFANNKLKEDLSLKTRELTSHALLLIQRNQLLDSVDKELKDLSGDSKTEVSDTAQKLSRISKIGKSADHDWENFKLLFDEVHPEFFSKLSRKYPALSASELRLCAMVKLNLRTTQIAAILRISPDSVKTSRYRIRKKLALSKEIDLTSFIIGNF